jgi:hypothetical protein
MISQSSAVEFKCEVNRAGEGPAEFAVEGAEIAVSVLVRRASYWTSTSGMESRCFRVGRVESMGGRG